jgi:regulator of replication initiation timing
MQDYGELHMETEAMRKRLQAVRERKATLMAEVRFLRRRYRHLRQDQPQEIKKVRRSNGGKKIRVEVSPSNKSEAETKHVSLPDLNHSEKAHDETKTSPKRRVPLFDLNQISGEEEQETEAVDNNQENTRVEESNSCKRLMISSIEMQQKDVKPSSCRNGGNGSNKRKISWQDPVAALRV